MPVAYHHKEVVAVALGRSTETLDVALAALEGKDHHDWLEELPNHLGISYEQCVAGLFDVWLTDQASQGVATNTFRDFTAMLSSDGS